MGYKRGDPGVDFTGEVTLTVQADAKQLDINKMVQKIRNGQAVPVYNGQPFYGDVSQFKGLAESFEQIQNAEELFMQFDASIREKFDNDMVKFVEFLDNPANSKEAESLGLVSKKPEQVDQTAETASKNPA